jgi:uridylate kinase
MKDPDITVIALGGSLIVPHFPDNGGINVPFLKKFRAFVLGEFKKGRRFIVVAGGGKTARVYQNAGTKIGKISNEDLDWLGVHSTRLNAHLLRTIFAKEAHPVVIDHDLWAKEVKRIQRAGEKILVASGWIPGWSTDYIAVRLAEKFGAHNVIIAGDTAYVYEKDPRKFPKAKALPELSWREYEKLIPKKWTPGFSSPVDPVATRLAKKTQLQVKVLKGTDLANLKKAIDGKKFKGTIIS